ncbi:MAG: response regulator transcription factor [Acidobacteria bacterium]|nr:response regulator transcription factor [Acidobacteriota bacterium]
MNSMPVPFPAVSGARLLLVDDNPKLCRMVKEYLEPLGYDVSLAHTGPAGLEKALCGDFHAVILDVMLPGLDGFEVLKRLRQQSTVPVLMLTGRGEPQDRIAGLDLGADDYVPKTFSPRELLARLRAVIRRSLVTAALVRRAPQAPAVVGDLIVDPEKRSAELRGSPLALTPAEFGLLFALANDCGRIKSREQLLLEVADRDFEAFDRSIDVHISSLRRKLGDDPKHPRFILTVRSAGYMLKEPAQEPAP